MSQTAQQTPPTHSSDLTAGLESLEEETRVDSLPLEGQIPAWSRARWFAPARRNRRSAGRR